MPKVKVELVKYDTEKTKKRKRENLLVDAKTEQAVIAKLEKILFYNRAKRFLLY